MPQWQMGHRFLHEVKKGILNFVIARPLCTALGLVTDAFGLYGEGQIDFTKSYVYLAAATNFSQVRSCAPCSRGQSSPYSSPLLLLPPMCSCGLCTAWPCCTIRCTRSLPPSARSPSFW